MSEIKKPDIYKMNLPADLKKLSTAQCEELCGDIRKILIDTVSKNGGHLASNLGTVDRAMAAAVRARCAPRRSRARKTRLRQFPHGPPASERRGCGCG